MGGNKQCSRNKENKDLVTGSLLSHGMADEDAEQEIRSALDVVQSMIDISAERLEGLRTQCSTGAELTQQEIRTLEVISNLQYFFSPFILSHEKYYNLDLAISSLKM